MKLKCYIKAGVVAMAASTIGMSCTDTWDDHYSVNGTVPGATLWENMRLDESIHPFVRVLDSCGYKDMLNGTQTFTVWAPKITDEEAQRWIDTYKSEKSQGVKDDYNTTLNQFVRNHLAIYNHQVSSETDTIVEMMNGKRMSLTAGSVGGALTDGISVPSSNGVLYKLEGEVPFTPNIWERIRMRCDASDDGMDSVANFFLSWNRTELDEKASVPGPVVDGKTVYLDSVMYDYNSFFDMYGSIDSEDSSYWFVAPTNKVWREKVEEYRKYFEYHSELKEDGDSLQDMYSKRMVLHASFFNMNENVKDGVYGDPADSLCSTSYTTHMLGYSKFDRPFGAGGLLEGLTPEECSNGRLYVAKDWRVPPTITSLMRKIEVEAEYSNNYTTRRLTDPEETDENKLPDPMQVSSVKAVSDSFKVSSDGYLLVRDPRTGRSRQPEISFKIPYTLSNCPYDIKVVFATPLAGDPQDSANAALKRQITAKIRYYGSRTGEMIKGTNAITLSENLDVDATKMDTVTVAEGVKFPVCNFAEQDSRVLLTIQSIRGRSAPDGYSQDLLIDCVIFEPRPEGGNDEN